MRRSRGPAGTGTGFRLATGEHRWKFSTPRGMFRVRRMEKDPLWEAPDWHYVEKGLPIPAANSPSRLMRGVMGTTAIYLGDGIAIVHGLEKVMAGEMVDFGNNIFGLTLKLDEDSVGCVIMGEVHSIKEGQMVRRTKRIIQVPVGEALIGRVVDPLGMPLDGKAPTATARLSST